MLYTNFKLWDYPPPHPLGPMGTLPTAKQTAESFFLSMNPASILWVKFNESDPKYCFAKKDLSKKVLDRAKVRSLCLSETYVSHIPTGVHGGFKEI